MITLQRPKGNELMFITYFRKWQQPNNYKTFHVKINDLFIFLFLKSTIRWQRKRRSPLSLPLLVTRWHQILFSVHLFNEDTKYHRLDDSASKERCHMFCVFFVVLVCEKLSRCCIIILQLHYLNQ